MASTDALPVPRKNTAFRVTFPLLDADGDLVSGAAGLDSEVSKDGGSFADCTNEATEIGTSGIYTLDLTSTEMNADCVAIIVKTSTTGAKTTVIILYPEEIGDFRVNVEQIAGGSSAATNLRRSTESVYYGTITSGTPTTTTLIDSGLTQGDADFWKGRILIFLTGALAKQATDITGFTPASDTLTFTAVTTAATVGDTYVIV